METTLKEGIDLESIMKILKKSMPKDLFEHSVATYNYSLMLLNTHISGENVKEQKENPEENPKKKKVNINNINNIKNIDDIKKNIRGIDVNKVFNKTLAAALLHDYGKIFSYNEILKIIEKNNLKIPSFEKNNPKIIHSFIAPFLLKRDFNIYDNVVLSAVKKHTIGAREMNIVDKIIYISDKLEPTRNYDDIDYLRKLSKEDFNLCLLEVYKSNIIYVISKNYLLHPDTSKIWNNICGGFKNATR